jgi:hypothetical protein
LKLTKTRDEWIIELKNQQRKGIISLGCYDLMQIVYLLENKDKGDDR